MATQETVNLKELEDFYRSKVDFHNKKVDFYIKKLEAVEILKQPEETETTILPLNDKLHKSLKIFLVPQEYSVALSQKEKVYFALREIKEGLNKEVAIQLAKLEPELGVKKIKKMVTTNLDILKREGYIRRTKIREKLSKYFIN
jgi:hypothetical protein